VNVIKNSQLPDVMLSLSEWGEQFIANNPF